MSLDQLVDQLGELLRQLHQPATATAGSASSSCTGID
jgi:hypothetical protein